MLGRGARERTSDDDLSPEAIQWCEWEAQPADEGWLVSYADMLSVILAMVVLLLGRMVMANAPAVVSAQTTEAVEVVAERGPDAPVGAQAPAAEPANAAGAMAERADARAPAAEPANAQARAAEPAPSVPEPPGPAPTSRESRLARLVERRFEGKVKAEAQEAGVLLTIEDVVLFDSSSAELQESAQPMLTGLARTLGAAGDLLVSVEGHTDSRPVRGGRFASNWDLAAARANAVTRFLLAGGLDRTRLRSVSYADTRPVADNDSAAGRAANRRVELRIEFSSSDLPVLARAAQ